MSPHRALLVPLLSLAQLALAACGDDAPDPTGPLPADVTEAERAALLQKFEVLSQRLADDLRVGFPVRPMLYWTMKALKSGAPVRTVRSSTGARYQVVVFQYAPARFGMPTYLSVFRDTTEIAFSTFAGSSVTYSTQGSQTWIWRAPLSVWEATAGGASVTRVATDHVCQAFEEPSDLSCRAATFDAVFDITASQPRPASDASGSRTFSLPLTRVGGIAIGK